MAKLNRVKIHKATKNPRYWTFYDTGGHLCGTPGASVAPKYSVCCEYKWKFVTCKLCLKLRRNNAQAD